MRSKGRRKASAARLFAALCAAAVLSTWMSTPAPDEAPRLRMPPPQDGSARRRAVESALAPCATELQNCRAMTRSPMVAAIGTAVDATVSPEMRSALKRALASSRDEGAGDLRPARQIRRKCVVAQETLAHWAAHEPRGRVVFTVADKNYAEYMSDAKLDTLRAFGGSHLLVIALDEAAAIAACAAGCSVIRVDGTGRDAIYAAKYGTLHELLKLGRDATFREMDIWHLGDPLLGVEDADVVLGVHQDNPYNLNAGWLHARARGATAEFFSDLVRYLQMHPLAFDQQVLNCMLRGTGGPRDECIHTDGSLSNLAADEDPILKRWVTGTRITHSFVGPDVLVAHARPYVMWSTRAVHVLTTIPLTDARGKTDVARELMLWPGADDYYRVGGGHRYLAVAGGLLSTSSPHHFHDWRWINAALTELIWLARLTGRVLVWPRIFDFQQYHHAADHVDLRSVEDFLGGWRSWRESTFFANPRLDVTADAAYASLSLRGSKATVTRRNRFDGAPVKARTYTLRPQKKGLLDAWAIALDDADLRAADVLSIDIEPDDSRVPLAQCFHIKKGGSAWSCEHGVGIGRVPREIALVQASLNWCRQRLGADHAKAPNGDAAPVGYQPSKTCAVRLATGLVKKAAIAPSLPGRNSVVDS